MADLQNGSPQVAQSIKPQPGPAKSATTKTEELPKLSAADYRAYNRMAEHMDLFHNHFRNTWNTMYDACSKNQRPSGMSIRQFIMTGLQFCHSLETHHGIEEAYVFPMLGKKMPAFRNELELLAQHKQIHIGLDKFEDYLTDCRSGKRELRLDEMKAIMETFGTVLWTHLDDEVHQLGAENMRKFWTLDEMRQFVM